MEMDLKQLNYGYVTGAPGTLATAPSPAAAISPAASPAVVVLNGNGIPPLGPVAQRMTCPSCHNMMQPRLERRANKNTHLIAIILCLTGLCCLVPLPYCLKSCRSVHHYCSCCNYYLGKAND